MPYTYTTCISTKAKAIVGFLEEERRGEEVEHGGPGDQLVPTIKVP